jgi:hypothetical protein
MILPDVLVAFEYLPVEEILFNLGLRWLEWGSLTGRGRQRSDRPSIS